MAGVKQQINTGLLFGSFNPVHIGHIAIAGYMKEFAGMDEIWFIVSPQNPFKDPVDLATPAARLHMVSLATEARSGLVASDIEFGMAVPSYTLDTMKMLALRYPGRNFHIITGTDNLNSITRWKGGVTLARDYNFLIYPRPGSETDRPVSFSNATVVDAPLIGISSSFIREAIGEGKEMSAFLPCKVWEYILKNRIYMSR